MHYECRNGNYIYAGNPCPRVGHHFQAAQAARIGYQCDVRDCGAKLVRVESPAKEHGRKRIGFVSKETSIKRRFQKGPRGKSAVKKYRVSK